YKHTHTHCQTPPLPLSLSRSLAADGCSRTVSSLLSSTFPSAHHGIITDLPLSLSLSFTMGLILHLFMGLFCTAAVVHAVGVDPALRISVFQEFSPKEFPGVKQVRGFHDDTRAFLFQGSSRSVRVPDAAAESVMQKLSGKKEFSISLTLQQDTQTTGVILSIRHRETRLLELESSGQKSEVRLHFQTTAQNAHSHTETLPFTLADGRWHRVTVSISAAQLTLYVDCNRIYERVIPVPLMEIPEDSSFWVGQRNSAHGLFKGVMQELQILVMPHGFIVQCPDLNRTCPTCNDFHSLVQKIMELQDILAKTSSKLSLAEEKMKGLDSCYCERVCVVKGTSYREDQTWIDGCNHCSCANGTVHCERVECPQLECQDGLTPTYVTGTCCRECKPVCVFSEKTLVEGQKHAVHHPSGLGCQLYECREQIMHRVPSEVCPKLSCAESDQITLTDRCCRVCKGHDFCAEDEANQKSICSENSLCVNLDSGTSCRCRSGFRPLRPDSAYCHDIDECAEGRHYCRENTACVNTAGSFMCVCRTGFIRIDDYSCTERDECASGQHGCDENALCFNTLSGHGCSCRPGYSGSGYSCSAVCDAPCLNGGSCISPMVCECPQGFTGQTCENDIDECSEALVQCDLRSTCVNLPGWYQCQCRDGYHDNGVFSANGESCTDIDECKTGLSTCANDSVCFNVDGSYECRCAHTPTHFRTQHCSGDCVHEAQIRHSGETWELERDPCTICSCQEGRVNCRRMVCVCEEPSPNLLCCPECHKHIHTHSSQCLHQNGRIIFNSGDTWIDNCQRCHCQNGHVSCSVDPSCL
ncbi:hypothetical protein DNTS_028374, partial [Danionella cerebrum]